ncbi:hypothetical protein GPEL0_01f2548 [Geoanaerobacter pelophilus]|uniref:Uncharacterized protein n=1 Tax=Geoanaerobacter pelophilus TaxID=60036 RepID=A0ABQ0MJ31_9BACT|nr:hypothetical protein GPEL0_01f2548 [Geoanaerobacter pelophilus]
MRFPDFASILQKSMNEESGTLQELPAPDSILPKLNAD